MRIRIATFFAICVSKHGYADSSSTLCRDDPYFYINGVLPTIEPANKLLAHELESCAVIESPKPEKSVVLERILANLSNRVKLAVGGLSASIPHFALRNVG